MQPNTETLSSIQNSDNTESSLISTDFIELMAKVGQEIINRSQHAEWVNRRELTDQIKNHKLRQRMNFAIIRLAIENLITINEQDSMLVKPANALSDFVAEAFDEK